MHTHPVTNEVLLRQLEWRYATKKFDPAKKITPSDWQTLERAIVLTPMSYGLQPIRAVVVDSPELRERFVPVSWGQTQPVDADRYIVFARRLAVTEADIDRYMARIAEVRGVTVESTNGFRQMLAADVLHGQRAAWATEWMARQAYIALGNLMTSAALLGIDTCPMEGFEPERYDEILNLPAQGYTAVVTLALGYRADDDRYALLKKVRLPHEEVVQHV